MYRVRFMPEKPGAWPYTTASSNAELNGKTGEFAVTKPSAQNHGPVRVAHTYHFAYEDGSPYNELGTTCYVWELQPESLQEETLKTLATAPFSKIRFCVFPKHYQWNTNEPILYPFDSGTGSLPVSSTSGNSRGQDARATTNWDFTHFNPKYFQHLEQRVADLQKLGIEADIILFHPYDEGHWGFDRMPSAVDDRYLHYVVARLSAYRNVWWSLANEWDFMKQKTESDFVRFGEIVSHDDPYHHLLSIHNGSKIFNHTLPWITHASIQNGVAVEEAGRAELYRDAYRKPIVYDEVKYEGNIESRWGQLSPEEMVFRFWNATIAGTYCGHGETYKSDDQVLWWSKGGVLKEPKPRAPRVFEKGARRFPRARHRAHRQMAARQHRRPARRILSHLFRQRDARELEIRNSETAPRQTAIRRRPEIHRRSPRHLEHDRHPGRRHLHAIEKRQLYFRR